MDSFATITMEVYGALVLLGGIFGYLKAKSKPSLIMGGIFGIGLVVVGIMGHLGWTDRAPEISALMAAFLLAFFGFRYMRKKKFMPAGMLATLSLVVLLVDLVAILFGGA